MRIETKNPVLAGTGLVTFKAGKLNVAPEYSHPTTEIHHRLRVDHLHHRFGLPVLRASLIADYAYGGTSDGRA